jgi:hypothetical protein
MNMTTPMRKSRVIFFDGGVRSDDVLDGAEEGKTRRREEDGQF